MNYFITAIDTDSGKTVVSSIICEALLADYWKPIQSGYPRDSDTVRQLVSNRNTLIHPEAYLLNTPASPHASAKIDNIYIDLNKIQIPQVISRDLVIEGAGGVMVPLNDDDFLSDLIVKLKATVILVCDVYLGSINHSLLTFEHLKQKKINIKGIIFNGKRNEESERIIIKHTKTRKLLHVYPENGITREVIKKYAGELIENWNE